MKWNVTFVGVEYQLDAPTRIHLLLSTNEDGGMTERVVLPVTTETEGILRMLFPNRELSRSQLGAVNTIQLQ